MKIPLNLYLCLVIFLAAIKISSAIFIKDNVGIQKPLVGIHYYIPADSVEMNMAKEFQKVNSFENEYLIKNGSDYILTSLVDQVQFFCKANYPVMWTLPFPEQFSGMTNWQMNVNSERTSKFSKKNKARPINKYFYAYLLIKVQSFQVMSQTGNLRCQSVQHSDVQSTIYVYSESESPISGINKLDKVFVDSTAPPEVVLPCRPTVPGIELSLFKQDNSKPPPPSPKVREMPKQQPTIKPLQPVSASTPLHFIKKPPIKGAVVPVPLPLQNLANANNFTWKKLELNSSITFDPKRGFILDKRTLPDILGHYNCSSAFDEEEKDGDGVPMWRGLHNKIIEVAQGVAPPTSYEFRPRVNLNSTRAKFIMAKMTAQCCTGNANSPPMGATFSCRNEMECEFFKPLFAHDVHTKILVGRLWTNVFFFSAQTNIGIHGTLRKTSQDCYTVSVINHQSRLIHCEGSDLDVNAQVFAASSSDKNTKTNNNPNFERQNMKLYDASSNVSTDYLIKFAIQISRGYSYLPVLRPGTEFLRTLPHFVDAVDTPLKIQRDRYLKNILPAFTDARVANVPYFDIDQWRYMKQQWYVPLTRDMFEGESIAISCSAHVFRYQKGGWLRLNWKNGTRTIFKLFSNSASLHMWRNPAIFDDVDFAMVRTNFASSDFLDHSVVGRIMSLDLEMKSIDCFAPVWNTNEWDKRTYELNIKPSTLPEIKDPSEEFVTFAINKTGYHLNCSLVATPQNRVLPVQLTWEKDGKKIPIYGSGIVNITTTATPNVTHSSLHFYNITHAMQGEYKCVAENVKGNVEKVFNVFVDDGKRNTIEIIGICLVCICSLAGVIIVVLSWKHLSLQSKIRKLMSGSW